MTPLEILERLLAETIVVNRNKAQFKGRSFTGFGVEITLKPTMTEQTLLERLAQADSELERARMNGEVSR
jgi:hypothetical protein